MTSLMEVGFVVSVRITTFLDVKDAIGVKSRSPNTTLMVSQNTFFELIYQKQIMLMLRSTLISKLIQVSHLSVKQFVHKPSKLKC